MALCCCLLLSLDSEGPLRSSSDVTVPVWKSGSSEFIPGLYWKSLADHKPVTFKTSLIVQICPFPPSLLAEWHCGVLADSPLPWTFPSMKLLSASDEWVLCLHSIRAKGAATIHTTTFMVWWIRAFTEIFITSPSLTLELNLSQGVPNLIYFLK